MTHARVIWPPYPYEAGFCITDDPDASTLGRTRAVYDFLMTKSIVTTKAVWAFEPELHCGIPSAPDSALRGVTLANPEFASYCRELYNNGVELCLHGASAGNNTRERTQEAFDLLTRSFGSFDTFICHSKNSDNIYWEEKTTALFPFRQLLAFYSKHTCSGEIPESPYYWGDLCSSTINQVRLFKMRSRNTLKRNPSMPYYDPHKPLVNGWFSATKRSLADCVDPIQLEQLKEENGLTVLYQYLYRYSNPETYTLDEHFVRSIDQLSGDRRVLVQTVSSIMKRLRQIQGVFVVYQDNLFWLINVNDEAIQNLQIKTDRPLAVDVKDEDAAAVGCSVVIRNLPKKSIKCVRVSSPVAFSSRNSLLINDNRQTTFNLPFGRLLVNLSQDNMSTDEDGIVAPNSFLLNTKLSGTGIPLLSTMLFTEECGLLFDQVALIGREVTLKGRSLNIHKYLDATREIPLEDQANW